MGPLVETRDGRLEGVRESEVSVFRGIPFARPPVGDLRFAPPTPPSPWTGVRPAVEFGPAAPQPSTGLASLGGFGADDASEDCLTLNVWTPALDGRRPVMVWIHGGGFVYGSGSQPIYDGAPLARRGDVVVVTVNYRLGALGFLHLGDLVGEEVDCTANAGLLDQTLALGWVRDNIEAFGGDPANVTIFGESAGGISVASLLGMPGARGLFHRAIAQSGAAHHVFSRDDATEVTRMLLSRLELEPGDARKLLELPANAIVEAEQHCWTSFMRARRGLPFRPVVDGDVFPRFPEEATAEGLSADIPVLVGTNVDEWRFFGFTDPDSLTLDDRALLARLDQTTRGSGAALVDVYAAGRPGASASDLWFAIESDRIFRVPATRLAEAQSRHQPRTFAYLFTWRSAISGLGACHAVELPFVFGTLDKPGMNVFVGDTPEAAELSAKVQEAWLAFARSGDPGHPGLPEWPAYDPRRRATMLLGEACRVEDAPSDAERRAWEGVL